MLARQCTVRLSEHFCWKQLSATAAQDTNESSETKPKVATCKTKTTNLKMLTCHRAVELVDDFLWVQCYKHLHVVIWISIYIEYEFIIKKQLWISLQFNAKYHKIVGVRTVFFLEKLLHNLSFCAAVITKALRDPAGTEYMLIWQPVPTLRTHAQYISHQNATETILEVTAAATCITEWIWMC